MRLQLAVADGGGAQRDRDAGEELRLELRVRRTRRRAGRTGCGAGPVRTASATQPSRRRTGPGVARRSATGAAVQSGSTALPGRAGGRLAGHGHHRPADGHVRGLPRTDGRGWHCRGLSIHARACSASRSSIAVEVAMNMRSPTRAARTISITVVAS